LAASTAGLDAVGIGAVAGIADAAFGAASGDASLEPPAAVAVVEIILHLAGMADPPAVSDPRQISLLFSAVGASSKLDGMACGSEHAKHPEQRFGTVSRS
jgi:hypothetical protein